MSEQKKSENFTTAFVVTETPEEVFNAINNVQRWWSEEIEGKTDALGAEFIFNYKDLHRSTQKIVEFVPGKKVVWHVSKSRIGFVQNKSEWDGTEVTFEIVPKGDKTEVRFSHVGLNKRLECFGGCSEAWDFYIKESLKNLITKGSGKPNKAPSTNPAKMVVIYKTPKDPAAFDKHYFEVHVPLAKKLPGLRKYEVSKGEVTALTGGPNPYLVGTLYFDDMNSIKSAFASEIGRACAADRKQLAANDEVEILLFDTVEQ